MPSRLSLSLALAKGLLSNGTPLPQVNPNG